ncbi:MAG: PilN domain-containing protein [Candidatus Omnitrophica bacterium]|nr:PilN domain-containing protein [Candidatus Omnitrophota bacterium]
MIELNLLPEELKKKRIKIELPDLPLFSVAGTFIAILVALQLALWGLIFLSDKQVTMLTKAWNEMAPEKANLDALKTSITNTTKKTKAIEELIKKRRSWTRLLNELSSSVTPNVWLTELTYDEKVGKRMVEKSAHAPLSKSQNVKSQTEWENYKIATLTIAGSAAGRSEEATSYVARFIQSLKDNKNLFDDFDDIELVSVKKSTIANQDAMNFILVCTFKSDGEGN